MALSQTERLYFNDSKLLQFTGRVVAHNTWQGKPSVILDRTAFYPESGGQLADTGTLGDQPIADVQVDDNGIIHHLLDPSSTLPAIDSEVSGSINAARRRIHVALHTGQHMLSRALLDVADAATVSSRLGDANCTIDVDKPSIDESLVAKAESLVQSLIDDDVSVRAFFPTADELSKLPLRRQPKVTDNIRVVMVGDFDVSPCGGTHCTNTAQIGIIRVTSIERYKGKIRVSFSAGPRARKELFDEAQVVRQLARGFTCGPLDVTASIDKLKKELTDVRERLGAIRSKLADQLISELEGKATTPPHLVIHQLDDAGVDLLRAISGRLIQNDKAVVLLAGVNESGAHILASRGKQATFDCGKFVKLATALGGGRGGGKPDYAEGKIAALSDWVTIANNTIEQHPELLGS